MHIGDAHVHTYFEADIAPIKTRKKLIYTGVSSPEQVAETAEEKNLDFIVICDRNEIRGAVEAKAYAENNNLHLEVIIGEEVVANGFHVNIPYMDKNTHDWIHKEPHNLFKICKERNKTPILCHAFALPNYLPGGEVNYNLMPKFAAIETANGATFSFANDLAKRVSKRVNLAEIGGSDAHWHKYIGTCFTAYPEKYTSLEEAIRAKATRACGTGINYIRAIFQYNAFVKDSFKNSLALKAGKVEDISPKFLERYTETSNRNLSVGIAVLPYGYIAMNVLAPFAYSEYKSKSKQFARKVEKELKLKEREA